MSPPDASAPSIDTLLRHREWVSSVARTLVRDHATADDLAQEAWLAAVRRPPADVPSPRGWLTAVLRRSAWKARRGASRRETRERVAARPEAAPAAADVVAQAETHARLVREVLALDEPYRTTILLRFFEDLPPREVARRMDAPVETVRARSRRALERLAERLDQSHGGRRAWVAALVPVGWPSAAAATTAVAAVGGLSPEWIGGLLVSTKTKVAVGAALAALLLAGGAVLLRPWEASDADGGEEGRREARLENPDVAPPGLAGRGDSDVRSGQASPDGAMDGDSSAPPTPEAPTGAAVRVRFLAGSPPKELSTAEVEALYASAGTPTTVRLVSETALAAESTAGIFKTMFGSPDAWQASARLRFGGEGVTVDPAVPPGRWRLFVARPRSVPWLTEALDAAAGGELSVAVPGVDERRTRPIRLVTADTGSPLAGARVVSYFEFGDDQAFLSGPTLTADARGEFDLPVDVATSPEQGRSPTWWALADGYAGVVHRAPRNEIGSPDPTPEATEGFTVRVPRTAVVEGKAYLRDGTPAVGKTVLGSRKGHSVRTEVGADGSFRLEGVPVEDHGFGDTRTGVVLLEDVERGHIVGRQVNVKAGGTATVVFGEPAGSGKTGRIVGRITVGGKGLPDAFVLAGAASTDRNRTFRNTDADGRFDFEAVPAGATQFQVYLGDPRASDDFSISITAPFDLVAGETKTFDFDLPDGAVRVTVLDDATGKPLQGAAAWGRPSEPGASRERFGGFAYHPGWAAFTDEKGVATLRGLPLGEVHTIEAGTRDGKHARAASVHPSGSAAPTEIVLRVKPKSR
jgi:RNA polymerase sigma-70 factor (ECF subfamily)